MKTYKNLEEVVKVHDLCVSISLITNENSKVFTIYRQFRYNYFTMESGGSLSRKFKTSKKHANKFYLQSGTEVCCYNSESFPLIAFTTRKKKLTLAFYAQGITFWKSHVLSVFFPHIFYGNMDLDFYLLVFNSSNAQEDTNNCLLQLIQNGSQKIQ